MITKDEALNTIAVKHGLRDWTYASMIHETIELEGIIHEAMDLYAEQSNSHKHSVGSKRHTTSEYFTWLFKQKEIAYETAKVIDEKNFSHFIECGKFKAFSAACDRARGLGAED